jgi:hypothetical protein
MEAGNPRLNSAAPCYSIFIPENLTTLPHFSVSSAMSLAKSAVDPDSIVAPNSANLASSLGSVKTALISMLSLSMIVVGVFLGAPMPTRAGLEARREICDA